MVDPGRPVGSERSLRLPRQSLHKSRRLCGHTDRCRRSSLAPSSLCFWTVLLSFGDFSVFSFLDSSGCQRPPQQQQQHQHQQHQSHHQQPQQRQQRQQQQQKAPRPSSWGAAGLELSPGCSQGSSASSSSSSSSASNGNSELASGWHSIPVEDFERVNRRFFVRRAGALALRNADLRAEPSPLLLSLHGQYTAADQYSRERDFGSRVGNNDRLLVVYPHGMDDGNSGTGWNCGVGGNTNVCLEVGVDYDCYQSCKKLAQCGRCNWSTCYDDRLFIDQLIDWLGQQACLDLHRVYLQGESNGGMMAHYLVTELPGRFAAVVPFYGLPLVGYGAGSGVQLLRETESLRKTAFLILHGRQDRLIPVSGGISSEGWVYEPLDKVHQMWGAVHGCNTSLVDVVGLPVSPDALSASSVRCEEFPGCTSNRRIMRCLYDGHHGNWPDQSVGEDLTVWFVTQFSRGHRSPNSFSKAYTPIEGVPVYNRQSIFVLVGGWCAVLILVAACCCLLCGCGLRECRTFLRLRFGLGSRAGPGWLRHDTHESTLGSEQDCLEEVVGCPIDGGAIPGEEGESTRRGKQKLPMSMAGSSPSFSPSASDGMSRRSTSPLRAVGSDLDFVARDGLGVEGGGAEGKKQTLPTLGRKRWEVHAESGPLVGSASL